MVALDGVEVKQFGLIPFLEDLIKYGVKFLTEVDETTYVMGIKNNVISFNE